MPSDNPNAITLAPERIYLHSIIDSADDDKIRALVNTANGMLVLPQTMAEPPPSKPRKRRVFNPNGPQTVITALLRLSGKEGASEAAIITEVRARAAIKKSDPDSVVITLLKKNPNSYRQLQNGNWALMSVLKRGA